MGGNVDLCEARVIHPERINRARGGSLDPLEIARVSRIFKAMGDPTRLRILWALGSQELCVCDLAATLWLSESATSHQLRNLRHLDLVTSRREGTILYYRLNDHHVRQLMGVALEHVREG
ncbi:MAG: metalloregulator ArsR/SmtB family transcription factor [bacterium]|nr:metalloregulator ArsR/SmtB family transcription factor [bacterium]